MRAPTLGMQFGKISSREMICPKPKGSIVSQEATDSRIVRQAAVGNAIIERLLPHYPAEVLASAAKVRFSNWVSGSSSFPFIYPKRIVCPGHASLRSLFGRSKGAAACMCRIGSGEPRFPARFKLRSRHFRLHPHTSSGWTIPFRLGGGLMGHAWAPICS